MRHRRDTDLGDRQLHPGEQSSRRLHYAASPGQGGDGLPWLGNRVWGLDRIDDSHADARPGQDSRDRGCSEPAYDIRPMIRPDP